MAAKIPVPAAPVAPAPITLATVQPLQQYRIADEWTFCHFYKDLLANHWWPELMFSPPARTGKRLGTLRIWLPYWEGEPRIVVDLVTGRESVEGFDLVHLKHLCVATLFGGRHRIIGVLQAVCDLEVVPPPANLIEPTPVGRLRHLAP